ncbi:MAG: hypothetical protein H7317_00165 [Pseudorhodobacter sp.]|nr:hypothetical protein [Pseudorhodobacter sp.]
MLQNILASTLIAALCASATYADTQVVKQLKACGSEAKNSFGTHTEHPIEDEGAGYISVATEDTDATGTKERFTLVNCATRKLVQLNAEYLLTDSSKGLPGSGDLFTFATALSKQNKLANEALFAAAAKAQGYPVKNAQLPPKWSEPAKRADCGCQLFYPETMN